MSLAHSHSRAPCPPKEVAGVTHYTNGQKVLAKVGSFELPGVILGSIFPDLWFVDFGKPYSEIHPYSGYEYQVLLILGCNIRPNPEGK